MQTMPPDFVNTPSPDRPITVRPRPLVGGIHPPENKAQSLHLPIATAPLPEQVILPLTMHAGSAAKPVVQVGDTVATGQLLARADGPVSAAVHASLSGRVIAIEDRPIAHSSGLNAPCVVIESDGEDRWTELHPTADYRALRPAELRHKLQDAGLAGLGGAGFPTAAKLNASQPIHSLIINGAECEPYITADHALMREHADQIIAGTLLLAYILDEPAQILIGIEANKPDAIAAMDRAIRVAGDRRLSLHTFPARYPSGGEKQIIQILTGREVPAAALPAELGILVQNPGTAVAALHAINHGRPLISRITTLVGKALTTERNFHVRLGTPVQCMLDHAGIDPNRADRVIMGGPMMGFSLLRTDVPITKITNCLLVPTRAELPPAPPALACIRCGHCAEVCPASLLPQQLFWYAQSEDHERLKDHNLFDCIECGACAYVCPSHIPLVQYYRAAKGDIRTAEREKVKSDRARARFEARQERVAQQAAERAAKRRKRMAAAKARQAAGPVAGPIASSITSSIKSLALDDNAAALIAQAQARVAQADSDPAATRARLERQQQTLTERIEQFTAKAQAAPTAQQRDHFIAQQKNATQRLRATKQKLKNLPRPEPPNAQDPKNAPATPPPPSDERGA